MAFSGIYSNEKKNPENTAYIGILGK